MSRHAQIEEVSDSSLSDADASDPSDADPNDFAPMPIRPHPNASSQPAQLIPQSPNAPQSASEANQKAQIKPWACIYPVYFDATRTRAEGRRVGKELGVENPLAREIADAVREVGLQCVLEPGKTHPKDWANPGRVKVRVRGVGGKVKNKHHLYIFIAEWLRKHPTTKDTPLKLPVQGLRQTKVVPPNKPRGWKMGSILPLHSPGVTGGGVSENMLKDMMAEMQKEQEEGRGLPPGAENLAGMQSMLDAATPGAGGGGGGGGSSGGQSKKKKKGKA